jgi:hypothetical protein
MIFFSFKVFSFKNFYSNICKYYKIIIDLILNNNPKDDNPKDDNPKDDNPKDDNPKDDNPKNDTHKKIILNNPIIEKKYCYICFNQIKKNTYCVFDKIFCTEYCRDSYIIFLEID